MEIADFTYHRPANLGQACELLSELGDGAHVLAGGTEALVDLKQHTFDTRHLVSLRDLEELRAITVDKRGLHVGSMVTHGGLVRSETIRKSYPALSEAAATMAAVQVRNRGTIGGNFCSAVPSADLPPICIAGSASVRLVGSQGERTIPADDFIVGPRRTLRERDEVLAEIIIPPMAWASGTGASYHKFGLRSSSALAVAGVAAWVRLEKSKVRECRIVLGAVHSTPLLATEASAKAVGKAPSTDLSRAVGKWAAEECSPIDDLRGSADYRRELVRVLTARALDDACGRAAEGRHE
jgi:carbon-monoxide dehydrogenase medium subunit